MKPLNILVVGSGMYVCGRGTDTYGTIMPALCEWRKHNALGNIYIAGASPEGVRVAKKKIDELCGRMGVKVPVRYFPKKAKKGARSFEDALSVISRPACAIVAVPDDLHSGIAGSIIGKGLHTLVVKPLAPTMKEVKGLIELQDKNDVYCAVEFHKRLDRANMKLRDAIRSGVIGEPLYCLAEFSQRKSMPTKIFKKWAGATNIFQYLGIHYVDIVYFTTSAKPLRAMAVGQKNWLVRQGIDTYDSVEAVIEWKLASGRKFVSAIIANWIDPETTSAMSDQKIKLVGTKGRIESDQKKRGMTVITDENGVEEPNPYFCSSFGPDGDLSYMGYGIETIHQFLGDVSDIENKGLRSDSLEGKRPTFKESIVPTAVLEAVNKSLKKNGEWVSIKI